MNLLILILYKNIIIFISRKRNLPTTRVVIVNVLFYSKLFKIIKYLSSGFQRKILTLFHIDVSKFHTGTINLTLKAFRSKKPNALYLGYRGQSHAFVRQWHMCKRLDKNKYINLLQIQLDEQIIQLVKGVYSSVRFRSLLNS